MCGAGCRAGHLPLDLCIPVANRFNSSCSRAHGRVVVQEENARLKQQLMQASTEQMLVRQELDDANVVIDTYGRSKEPKATQTVAVNTTSFAAQADASAAAGWSPMPQQPTASRVQRRSAALDITGLAHEMAPEGVGAASVGTRVLGAGLLKPTVRLLPTAHTKCAVHNTARPQPRPGVAATRWKE